MTTQEQLSPDVFLKTLEACIGNGERLLQESYDLEFGTPPASQFYLIMIAQEEFSKAFILYLLKNEIIPFTPAVRRAINDHTCKQLVSMIMDYIIMHWESVDELHAEIDKDFTAGDNMPAEVGSAMELLRYEKIGRWEANNWVWAEERWPPSFGQFGGLIKLSPGVVHAASLLLAVAGASPGNGVGSIM